MEAEAGAINILQKDLLNIVLVCISNECDHASCLLYVANFGRQWAISGVHKNHGVRGQCIRKRFAAFHIFTIHEHVACKRSAILKLAEVAQRNIDKAIVSNILGQLCWLQHLEVRASSHIYGRELLCKH